MMLEREVSQQAFFQRVTDWIQAEAEAAKVAISIRADGVEEREGDCYTFVLVPIKVLEAPADFDKPRFLAELEGKWNDTEPRPEKLIFPYPASVPRHAV